MELSQIKILLINFVM